MKLVFTIAIIVLLNAAARAQTGMPQSLSCTETAFNFSFSLGTKWKFSAPKMGPVDVRNWDYDMPVLDLKIRTMKTDTNSVPVSAHNAIPESNLGFTNFYPGLFYKKLVNPLYTFNAKL